MMFGLLATAAIATAPVPAMTTDWWSDYYDTPARGLLAGELSVVIVDITVNTYGAFAGCVGHAYAGNPQMAPYVCSRLAKRGTFVPARGPDGQKVTGIYRKLITVANVNRETAFQMPHFGIHIPSGSNAGSTHSFEIQFFLAEDGKVSDCSLIDAVGINLERHKQVADPESVRLACSQVTKQLNPTPPRDSHGAAIPTTQNALVHVDRALESQNH